jgi:hypothetical protein
MLRPSERSSARYYEPQRPPSFLARLAKLEARRPGRADAPFTPPEPPPGWCEEVLRLLRDYGYLDDILCSWGLTGTDIATVYASIEEDTC